MKDKFISLGKKNIFEITVEEVEEIIIEMGHVSDKEILLNHIENKIDINTIFYIKELVQNYYMLKDLTVSEKKPNTINKKTENSTLKEVKLTYTKEMEEQDRLHVLGKSNLELMKELHKSIYKEADSKGWEGLIDFDEYDIGAVVEFYPNKETWRKYYHNDYEIGEEEYTLVFHSRCIDVLKKFESDINHSLRKKEKFKKYEQYFLTYTEEMEEQDKLHEDEIEDIETMKELHRQIVLEAVSKGWKGYAEFMTYNGETTTELYPDIETYAYRESNGYEPYSLGKCSAIIKEIEKDLQKNSNIVKSSSYKVSALDGSETASDSLSYIYYNLRGRPNPSSDYPEDNLESLKILGLQIVNAEDPFEFIVEIEGEPDIDKYLNLKDIEYEQVYGNWNFGIFEENPKERISKLIEELTDLFDECICSTSDEKELIHSLEETIRLYKCI